VGVRLRQLVLVARRLEPLVTDLRRELGLGEPFHDPGVATFGLENAVVPVGDTFLEVVAPVRDGTAAGRYLERRGPGGYMVIFQVDDLEAARRRVDDLGVRVVWRHDLPDVAGTHLHPADVPGAIVSLDWAEPAASWRWAGPAWTGGAPPHPSARILEVTVRSPRATDLARRWADVLGLEPEAAGGGCTVALDGGRLRFEPGGDLRDEGVVAAVLALPGAEPRELRLGGVAFSLQPAD
jgi:hypothetical protein